VGISGAEWPEAVLEATHGKGVDVVLDLVGAPYLAGNLKVIAERGRWIVVGVTGGTSAEIDLRALMARRASLTGTVLRARPAEERMALARAFEHRVVPLFERGLLHPVVDRTFAPGEAGDAHRLMEEDRSFGKLLVVW
jgi:NADPH:quinone reductase-like Zn-dependent oxidoreductase